MMHKLTNIKSVCVVVYLQLTSDIYKSWVWATKLF